MVLPPLFIPMRSPIFHHAPLLSSINSHDVGKGGGSHPPLTPYPTQMMGPTFHCVLQLSYINSGDVGELEDSSPHPRPLPGESPPFSHLGKKNATPPSVREEVQPPNWWGRCTPNRKGGSANKLTLLGGSASPPPPLPHPGRGPSPHI